MSSVLQHIGLGLGYTSVWVLCAVGIIASCLSFSGTWFVAGAAALATLLSSSGTPGWWTVVAFALLCLLAEIIEAFAGSWGVTRRGGSFWAGAGALLGGLVGMVLGSFIPPPVIGTLVGMLAGSFALAFAVERYRLKESMKAAHIAWGAVVARIAMIFLKVIITLGMTAWMAVGMIVR